MTAPRSIKESRLFHKLHRADAARDDGCTFCKIAEGDGQFVEETKSLKVIRNRLPYSIWDGQGVVDHLMIVPKQHTDKLGDLGSQGAVEFIELVDRYESDGYNLYARAPGSSVKSVVHQHSHLIKLDGRTRKFVFLLHKPFYIRMSK